MRIDLLSVVLYYNKICPMKKLVFALLTVLMICSCIRSQKSSPTRTVKLINETDYVLSFSEINNGGDSRFWPETEFTLQPHEEYYHVNNEMQKNEPAYFTPLSMTMECNGKSIHFTQESDFERNPCVFSHYQKLDNFSKYGPGIHYVFDITNDDIDQWFGKE